MLTSAHLLPPACTAKRSIRQEMDLELKGLEGVSKAGEVFAHDVILPANVSHGHHTPMAHDSERVALARGVE